MSPLDSTQPCPRILTEGGLIMSKRIALLAVGLLLSASSGAGAQGNPLLCGDCFGVPGVAHVFTSIKMWPQGTHHCDNAGCHFDWYTPGCEAHVTCYAQTSPALGALPSILEAGTEEEIAAALAEIPTWSYDPQKATIDIEDCRGILVARVAVPEGAPLPKGRLASEPNTSAKLTTVGRESAKPHGPDGSQP